MENNDAFPALHEYYAIKSDNVMSHFTPDNVLVAHLFCDYPTTQSVKVRRQKNMKSPVCLNRNRLMQRRYKPYYNLEIMRVPDISRAPADTDVYFSALAAG